MLVYFIIKYQKEITFINVIFYLFMEVFKYEKYVRHTVVNTSFPKF